jgi:hypothetical protein
MSAIRPPDPKWPRRLVLRDEWRVLVRPVRPDDDLLVRDLLGHVSKEDLRLRFFDSIKEFSQPFIAKLTALDGRRAMAFVAIDEADSQTLGVVWLYCDSIGETGEYAILLSATDYRARRGLRPPSHLRRDSSGKFHHAENVPRAGISGQDRCR